MLLREFKEHIKGRWNIVYDAVFAKNTGALIHKDLSRSLQDYPSCHQDDDYLIFQDDVVWFGFPNSIELLGKERICYQSRYAEQQSGKVVLELLGGADRELQDSWTTGGYAETESKEGFSDMWSAYAFQLERERLLLQYLDMPYLYLAVNDEDEIDKAEVPIKPEDRSFQIYQKV